MIKSMTGYGLANFEDDNFIIQVEVKTLNSKFIDLNLRAPRQFSDKETEIRTFVANILERGKVNISIEFTSKKESELPILIQEELFEKYYKKYTDLSASVGDDGNGEIFRLALQSPNVCVSNAEKTENSQDWEAVKKVLVKALNDCDDFRKKEGEVLYSKFRENTALIYKSLEEIKTLAPIRKQKLKDNWSSLKMLY